MKQLALMTTLGLMMIFSLSAQKVTDQKAKDVLDAASTKIQTHKTIKIDFTFTENEENKTEGTSRKGRIMIKGNKYQLRFAGQVIYCDGVTKWTYITDAEEVHITKVKNDDEDLANPSSLLKNYGRKFAARWIKEETQKGKKCEVIDLYPKKMNKGYHRVRLNIDKISKQINSTTIYYVNNSSHTIDIDKYTTNEVIAEDQFKWDKKKYPNVEEIDLRK